MKLPVLLAAAALAVCLTGCSHAQTDATPSATSETAEAAATATPAATPATLAEPVCAEVGTILPETADAGRSYVDETLFIGDSNTARYLLYANETGTAFTSLNNNIGVVSMGVGSITSLKCEKFKGSSAMYTVPDAVAMLKPKRIIICYGTNNLSGSSTDATNYIKTYLQGLQAIQTAWPYCDIIVSAIPPLDRQRENTNLTMTQVDAYNAALVQMCEENGFKFLNSAEVLRDDATGWAKRTTRCPTACTSRRRPLPRILPTCAPMLMPPRTAARSRWARSRHRTVCPRTLSTRTPSLCAARRSRWNLLLQTAASCPAQRASSSKGRHGGSCDCSA